MDLKEQLRRLTELQKTDLKLSDVEGQRKRFPEELADLRQSVTQAQVAFSELRKKLDANQASQKELDENVKKNREQEKKWEKRLMEIRNTREHQALLWEIGDMKKDARHWEEQLLALMATQEELLKGVTESEASYEKLKALHDEKEKEVSAKLVDLDRDIKTFKDEREKLTADLDSLVMKRYDNIRTRKSSPTIVPIREGHCFACHIALRPQLVNDIQRAIQLETCPSCHRILYHEKTLYPDQATN